MFFFLHILGNSSLTGRQDDDNIMAIIKVIVIIAINKGSPYSIDF